MSPGKLILFLIIFFQFNAIAQIPFREADSTSYALFQQKNWAGLLTYSERMTKAGHDYHLMNLRAGIAAYKLESMREAEFFLKKAHNQNAADTVSAEYLYWIYSSQNRRRDADIVLNPYSESVRDSLIRLQRFYTLSPDAGIKFQSIKNTPAMLIGGISARQNLFPYININQQYLYMEQTVNWGKYYQNMFQVSADAAIHRNFDLLFFTGYANYNSTLDFRWRELEKKSDNSGTIPPQPDTTKEELHHFSGKYNLQGILLGTGLRFRTGALNFTPEIHIYPQWENPSYTDYIFTRTVAVIPGLPGYPPIEQPISEVFDTLVPANSFLRSWQAGTSISFNKYKGIRGKTEAGISVYYAGGTASSERPVFSPYFDITRYGRFGISGSWIKKGYYPLSVRGGFVFLNNYDKVSRLTLGGWIQAGKKTQIHVALMYDKITDSLSWLQYSQIGIFTSIQIQL